MGEPLVALAMPHRGGLVKLDAAEGYYRSSQKAVERVLLNRGFSILTANFNALWVQALNLRGEYPLTHFAMQHDDVCPDPGSLDVLLDEMDATGADMVSAAVPIKRPEGLTSTAVGGDTEWVVRRVTMAELYDLPATFGIEDVPWRKPDDRLLANTGLWVCRFDRPWVEQICFRQHDRIVRKASGEFVGETFPEDWDFSRQLARLGLKVVVTRKVGLYHERPEFHNRSPWGAWQADEAFLRRQG